MGDSVILVGGTGLIGLATAKVLAGRGLLPIAISRHDPAPGLLPSSARHHRLDRTELPSLLAPTEGSPLALTGRTLGVVEILAEETSHVRELLEAIESHAGRTVAIGSAAALGPSPRGKMNAEEEPPRPNSDDMRTKVAIEALLAEHHETGRASINLRCAYPYGPGHGPMTPLGRDPELFEKLSRHESISWVESGGLAPLQPLWVDDLAEAITELLLRPEKPETLYHIAGPEVLSWGAYLRALSRGSWPQRNLHRPSVASLQAENPEAWWLRDHLPHSPLLDDTRLRRDVYACTTKLSQVADLWAADCARART